MREKLTDEMLEEKLAKALDAAAPDMLGDLMEELEITDDAPPMLKDGAAEDPEQRYTGVRAADRKKRPGLRSIIAACAAVLVMAAVGAKLFDAGRPVFAVVGLDVNPSLELSIDDSGKVIKTKALNADGRTVLGDMKLKGTDVNVASQVIIASMLLHGYLNETSNSVLVTVRSDDPARGREIEQAVAGDLDSIFHDSSISGAVLGEYVEDDDELEDFAELYGISIGKAWLIRRIASVYPGKTPEALTALSTQELILLAQQDAYDAEVSYGSADTSKYIGSDKALEIALGKAGVSKSEASRIETGFDAEDGRIVYEVDFTAGGIEYEYDIDAMDGTVVAYETDNDPDDDLSDDDDDPDDDGDDIYDRDDDDDDRDDIHERDDDDDDDRDDDRGDDDDDDDDD